MTGGLAQAKQRLENVNFRTEQTFVFELSADLTPIITLQIHCIFAFAWRKFAIQNLL